MNISSYPDRELLKIASGFKKHLKDKIPTMKSVYSDLDEGFIYKFKALFYEIQSHSREMESENISVKFNRELEILASQAKRFFTDFRFYLQKAFPYDSSLCETYGYMAIEKATVDYSALRTLLEKTIQLIDEKGTNLRAANCPDSTLEDVLHYSKQVNQVHDGLIEYRKKTDLKNKAHEKNVKELFKLMEIVHEAASKSLKDDPESLRQLTFPSKGYVH